MHEEGGAVVLGSGGAIGSGSMTPEVGFSKFHALKGRWRWSVRGGYVGGGCVVRG